MKKNISIAVVLDIAALISYVAALLCLARGYNRGTALLCMGVGSALLAFGAVFMIKEKKENSEEDDDNK